MKHEKFLFLGETSIASVSVERFGHGVELGVMIYCHFLNSIPQAWLQVERNGTFTFSLSYHKPY